MWAAETIEIESPTLVSTTVPIVDDWLLWSSVQKPIAQGTTVRWKAYEWTSLVSTSVEPGSDEDDGTEWDQGDIINRYAMFDGALATKTVDTSDIKVVLEPQTRADLVTAMNVTATSVTITHKRGQFTVFTETDTLFGARNAAWLLDWQAGDKYELEFTLVNGTVEVGMVAIGPSYYLGDAMYPFNLTLRDFSGQVRDTFGIMRLEERGSVNVLEYKLLPNPQSSWSRVYLWMSDQNGPIIWVGDFGETATITYGVRVRLIAVVNGPNDRTIEVDVESFDPT